DVGYVGDPELVGSQHVHSRGEIKVNACGTKSMPTRSGPLPSNHEQIILPHDSRDPFMIDDHPSGA
ncbi:MAG: hypothetical protein WA714_10395, partial [Candidatus Acidiferrales bacterium]